jgi:hypothetical protein
MTWGNLPAKQLVKKLTVIHYKCTELSVGPPHVLINQSRECHLPAAHLEDDLAREPVAQLEGAADEVGHLLGPLS